MTSDHLEVTAGLSTIVVGLSRRPNRPVNSPKYQKAKPLCYQCLSADKQPLVDEVGDSVGRDEVMKSFLRRQCEDANHCDLGIDESS